MTSEDSISIVDPPEAGAEKTKTTNGSRHRPARLNEIGFVGLGHMGTAMATNLAAAGYRVIAYVRRPDNMDKLAALGLEPTLRMADLFDCEFVITMLSDDNAVSEVVFGRDGVDTTGLLSGLKPGAVHLSMSTISTAMASYLAREHAARGQGYVAAPVFGNPEAASARELFVLAAGDPDDVERCRPLIDCLGQRTFLLGKDPTQANLIKLLGNMMSATAIETLGEAVALLLKRGIDPKPFARVLTSTLFGGRTHRIYAEKIVSERYMPGFAMPLALKDVRLALNEADMAGVPMPSVRVVKDRMLAGIAHGHADLDWSALGLIAREEAGLAGAPALAAG